MPVYHYTPIETPCKICAEGFEATHPASEVLTECPTCGKPVRRSHIYSVNTPKLMKPSSISDAKKAGFTVLKRISSGEFEKQ